MGTVLSIIIIVIVIIIIIIAAAAVRRRCCITVKYIYDQCVALTIEFFVCCIYSAPEFAGKMVVRKRTEPMCEAGWAEWRCGVR